MHQDSTPEIPYGFCHCGCGEKTTIATKTDRHARLVRGEPKRFIAGHQARVYRSTDPSPNPSGLCMCGCGNPTGIAKWTNREKGWVFGQPKRFIPGHVQRTFRRKPGTVHQHSQGYRLVYVPDHPFAQADGFVFEHRLIMEQKIGRHLEPHEQVHHIDRDRSNNHPDNLHLCSGPAEHAAIHSAERPWSRTHERCIRCGTTERKHNAHGLCVICYSRKR